MGIEKKILLILIVLFSLAGNTYAKHIIGGEMYYTYIGPGSTPNTDKYLVTLMLFRDDHAPADAAQIPDSVYIGIFNNDDGSQINNGRPWYVVQKSQGSIHVNDYPSCMVNRPDIGYHAATYSFEVDLPRNNKGYTATYQTCCRITPIDNIFNYASGEGSTFSCNIPAIIDRDPDSSPRFKATIDAVCGGKGFNLKFGAEDADGDSLSYAFESAYNGGAARSADNINPSGPPYGYVNYVGDFTPAHPLGNLADIDPATGTISGIAPRTGRYVITVAVTSWRDGRKLSSHRKDFIVNVYDCDFANALLLQKDSHCDDFTVTFSNDDNSSLNKTFYWEFYNSHNQLLNTSTERSPQITFPEAGDYTYKLVVNRGDPCADSAKARIGVYPGFFPKFTFDGKCINSEVFFEDHSTATYGQINYWHWDFGVSQTLADTSKEKKPAYTYTQPDNYNVSMIVQSSVGCRDTVKNVVEMVEKPAFSVTNDTLICSIDDLPLMAAGDVPGMGTVTWSPDYNISDLHSFNPVVAPKHTTTYVARYRESRGCDNIDSVVVRVVDKVTLKMPRDTTICLTDDVILNPQTDALRFLWSPADHISPTDTRSIVATPERNTTYKLIATIGSCMATGNVNVRTVPYPPASTIPDTAICIGSSIQLSASGGSIYQWEPPAFLSEDKIPNPISTPARTVQYVVRVNDVLGCPKPGFDTVMIKVISPFIDIGPRDTAIVIDEPLQLSVIANGSDFLWTPPTGLNDPSIPNPVAMISSDQQYIARVLTEGGCEAQDTISVKVYHLKPGFYIPNAFTPNQDKLNDLLRPIGIGLRSLTYFRIYNRYGQLIFSTQSFREGWDGTYRGSPQDPAVFAWVAEAVDYTGKKIQAKGSISLIR